MARKKTESVAESDPFTRPYEEPPAPEPVPHATVSSDSADVGNVSAYFKNLLRGQPHLLEERKNDVIYQLWLQDHPGFTDVPKNVQQGLSNVKSQMRKETGAKPRKMRRGRKPRSEALENGTMEPAPVYKEPSQHLESLEMLLDQSIDLARKIGGRGLEQALDHLRKARIQVGIKLGL